MTSPEPGVRTRAPEEGYVATATVPRTRDAAPAAPVPGPRRAKTAWKVVVAADRPWSGAVYETRAGKRREEFSSPEEFVQAVIRLTGWRLPE